MKAEDTVKIAAAIASCSSGLFLAVVTAASPAGADPLDPAPPPAPLPAAPDAPVLPPNGMQHLASPNALPPGSTMDPQNNDSPNVSYLKDLLQAVQNQQISGQQALIMGLAQRGMDTPIPDEAPGPNVPVTPADPAAAPPPTP